MNLISIIKKRKNIYWVLSIVLLTLFSCSKDKDNNIKLLKKLVEVSSDGTSSTTLFTYNGNEIVKTDNDLQQVDFTYRNGLITKVVSKDKATKQSVTLDFFYDKGNLASIKSSDNYEIKFINNSDEMVSYQKTTLNDKNEEVNLYHGVLTFKNKNLIKDNRTFDDAEPGIISNYKITYEYDLEKNALYNILGYDKLLNYNDLVSLNNTLISIVESNVINADDQITSSANFYKNSFEYDEARYPTVKISEDIMPEDGKSGYLKTQYFYE